MAIKEGFDGELLCPGCGSINLHHGLVTIFSRYEDQENVAVTTVTTASRERASVTSVETTAGKDNPSARRHGLNIRFRCEQCPGEFELGIAQHKGSTYLNWKEITRKR